MGRSARGIDAVLRFASSIYSATIATMFPATCAGCGKVGDWFCDSCCLKLTPDVLEGCRRCGRRGASGNSCQRCESLFPSRMTWVRGGFVYEGVLRRAVQRFKYHGEYRRGYDLGKRLLASPEALQLVPDSGVDIVVPVPLHDRRMRMRGFNQAEILAEVIADWCEAPITQALIRVRDTHPQVRLRAHQRQENVRDAFAVDESFRESVAGARVILVDDVMTTGATLGSAAAALQRAGASKISGLTLARDR